MRIDRWLPANCPSILFSSEESRASARAAAPFCVVLALFLWNPFVPKTAAASERASASDETRDDSTTRLKTRWADQVDPDNPLPEYPRPQMRRARWLNLNGRWQYAIRPKREGRPRTWDGRIVVPFAVQSQLSGVAKPVGPEQRVWYRRTFSLPSDWTESKLLLHFGAVDWDCTVWVNGRQVGQHKGGYDPFTFDVTEALLARAGSSAGRSHREHEIVVSVWDPTDAGSQARGKQVSRPHGIWYTAVTGIWQTVWLEPVPETYIDRLRIVPDAASSEVSVDLFVKGPQGRTGVEAGVFAGNKRVASATATENGFTVKIPKPRLWSPADPFLYRLTVSLSQGDTVETYFGLREIAVRKDQRGINRLFLNGKPLFQYGTLDQGWWPDGLYTAPTDEALKYDIEVTRRLGFNTIRKHVKVEPARWYYWCDKLGLLVWQDMPNGFDSPKLRVRRDGPEDVRRDPESAAQFERELKAMIDSLYNHPSIVMWVPFNEGWGQYQTQRITDLVQRWDPTRLVNNPSGWADRGVGHVHDIHRYPGPGIPALEERRAAVLGEFGGLGLPLKGHTWQDEKNWGYRSFTTRRELNDAYLNLLERLQPLIGQGLAAAIYTQTTDVEIEVNGLMTSDRAVIKLDADRAAAAAARLFKPAPLIEDRR